MQSYDATKEQRVTTRINGISVEHVIKPITDEDFLGYFDRAENLSAEDELILFYDLFVDRLEGIKGDLPANWKDQLPTSEKLDVAKSTLLHVEFVQANEPQVKEDEELSFDDYLAIDRNKRTYTLVTYFDGRKIATPYTLRIFTAKERKDFGRVQFSETSTKRFRVEYGANLFKKLLIGSESDFPPIIHQYALVFQHYTSDSLVMEKN